MANSASFFTWRCVPLIIYTARRGDTVQSVARRFSLGEEELVRLNALPDRTRLTAGLALAVPRGEARRRTRRVIAACSRALSPSAAGELMPCLSFFCPCRFFPAPGGALTVMPGSDCAEEARSCAAAPLLGLVNLDGGGAFSPAAAHEIISDVSVQDALIERAHSICGERGYRGLYLELGYLYPFDREGFCSFVRRAAESMHRRGRLLVCAAESGADRLGEADLVVLLCCDWGFALSSPRPISPADRIRAALEEELKGFDGKRLLMGFSWRGCCWTLPWRQGVAASAMSAGTAAELAVSLGADIKYDSPSAAPHFTYTDASGVRREVWYDDLRSAISRFELIDEYSLGGLCYRSAETVSRPLLYAQQAYFETAKFI